MFDLLRAEHRMNRYKDRVGPKHPQDCNDLIEILLHTDADTVPARIPSEERACAVAVASAWSCRKLSDSLPVKIAALSGKSDSVCSNCAGMVVNSLAGAFGIVPW